LDANGNMQGPPTPFRSFQACTEQAWGSPDVLNSYGAQPRLARSTFTHPESDENGELALYSLPDAYEQGFKEDFDLFGQLQNQLVPKIPLAPGETVAEEPVPLCPGDVPLPPEHLEVFVDGGCIEEDGVIEFNFPHWFQHFKQDETDKMAAYTLTTTIDCGGETQSDVEEIQGWSEDDTVFEGVISKEFTCPEFNGLEVTIDGIDTRGTQKTKTAIVTECGGCKEYEKAVGPDGTLQDYKNPCCDDPNHLCCENGEFQQDKLIPTETSRCRGMSLAEGGKEYVCLPDLVRCERTEPLPVGVSEDIYQQQLKFTEPIEGTKTCGPAINIFEQSISPLNPNFQLAVEACQHLPPPRECKPGETKTTGTNVGNCELTRMVCDANERWQVVELGVRPQPEVCDKQDNNCDGKIDNNILCFGCTVGETIPCVSENARILSPDMIECVQYNGKTMQDTSTCTTTWDRIDDNPSPQGTTHVVQTGPEEFAIMTNTDFGTSCEAKDLACCTVFNKETDDIPTFTPSDADVPKGYVKIVTQEVTGCSGDVELAAVIPPSESAIAVFHRETREEELPSALRLEPQCGSGLDVQALYDKSTVPIISFAEIHEGTILTEDRSSITARGISVEFTGNIDGVQVNLDNARLDVKNKALAVLAEPMKLTFGGLHPGIDAHLTVPLLLGKHMDPNSLGVYVQKNGEWEHLPGRIDGGLFKADIEHITQYGEEVTFMVAGSTCDGCKQAYLHTIRDVNSPLLVVLVHGFYSSPKKSMAAMIKQFDDEKVNVDVAVFGYAGMDAYEAAKMLGEKLHEQPQYEKIVFITHSLGGLVTREFLHNEEFNGNGLIPKIEAVIMAGSPNKGTPLAAKLDNIHGLSAKLLKLEDNAPIAGVHPETLRMLKEGLPYQFPPSIKVFSLGGTSDYFGIGRALGVQPPNDIFVSAASAKQIGTRELTNTCVDMVEQSVNHFNINKAEPQRYTLLYFLRELSTLVSIVAEEV